GGTEGHPYRLRLVARGDRGTPQRPRLPAEGRCVYRRFPRLVHGAEMGGGVQFRTHAPPRRIPDVLLGLRTTAARSRRGRGGAWPVSRRPCAFRGAAYQ